MKTVDDIRAILYLREDRDNPIVRRFTALAAGEMIECADDAAMETAIGSVRARRVASKEAVILKKFSGRMFQKCPGSPGMICCNYLLVNIGFNCLYNCTYCFLNYYLNSFGLVQFINVEDSLREIERTAASNPDTVYRIGSGEYTDSLMIDGITGIGESLIRAAAPYRNIFVELKTKSANIRHLLDIDGRGNAVLAWTLNTPRNIGLYEAGSASLEERLDAAEAASRAGYLTAFHFDPMIRSDGWVDEYLEVVDRLFTRVDPARVAWASLGCFRYSPGFREIIRDAFPGQALTSAELFPGPDGKFRYLKHVRVKAYRAMVEKIRSYSDAPFVYLCMETESVWREVFDVEYKTSEDLEKAFSCHLKEKFY
ncbi:MAG TPA: radical SAM protein [Spirochaetota bacterium]|nr:radical SAM protein [Spirochaetota bacterium]HPC40865.1 radical SAM protein [Spirochaetota bacterium]HPL19215.1 radical SAM protein [Spirochaetota bacterium]HQF07745.1 radical SAM protein [Spirochaetota bacterium]HQH96798.1 radical SAM protein [Spirochaetota bacterium]